MARKKSETNETANKKTTAPATRGRKKKVTPPETAPETAATTAGNNRTAQAMDMIVNGVDPKMTDIQHGSMVAISTVIDDLVKAYNNQQAAGLSYDGIVMLLTAANELPTTKVKLPAATIKTVAGLTTMSASAGKNLETIQRAADEFFDQLNGRLEAEEDDEKIPGMPSLNAHDLRRLLNVARVASTKKINPQTTDQYGIEIMNAVKRAVEMERQNPMTYPRAEVVWPSAVGGNQDDPSFTLTDEYLFRFMENTVKDLNEVIDRALPIPRMSLEAPVNEVTTFRNEDRKTMMLLSLIQHLAKGEANILKMLGVISAQLTTPSTSKGCGCEKTRPDPAVQDRVETGTVRVKTSDARMAATVENAASRSYVQDTISAALKKLKEDIMAEKADAIEPDELKDCIVAPATNPVMNFHNCNIGYIGGIESTIEDAQYDATCHQMDGASSSTPAEDDAHGPEPSDGLMKAILNLLGKNVPELAELLEAVQTQAAKNMTVTEGRS